MTSKAASSATRSGYGKLWGRGYESFSPNVRRILSVSGRADRATAYLQGLVTSDLTSEPTAPRTTEEAKEDGGGGSGEAGARAEEEEMEIPVRFTSRMRSTCFLDRRGRILTDALLWKRGEDASSSTSTSTSSSSATTVEYLIDVPADAADHLLSHLKQHVLRRSMVDIRDRTDELSIHAVYGTLNAEGAPGGYLAAMDPRHPSLGMRIISVGGGGDGGNDDGEEDREARKARFEALMNPDLFPPSPGTYLVLRHLAGIAEGTELSGRTALECNQEFLNAVSFNKGCYLGQELTARTNFTGMVRKRIVPVVVIATDTEIPRPWIMASMIQDWRAGELSKKKTDEDVKGNGDGDGDSAGGASGGGGDGGLEMALGDYASREGYVPPPLPKISTPGAGGISAMLMGSVSAQTGNPQESNGNNGTKTEDVRQQAEEELARLRDAAEKLRDELVLDAVPGASIVDKTDGKTIGKVLSAPAPGTTVLLAQMRLDRLGLLYGSKGGGGANKWSRTNRILIGDGGTREYRYLPYLPLWWPDVDPKTGKEKIVEDEEDEGDELD